MRKLSIAVPVVACSLGALVSVAEAGGPARLAGHFQAKVTITHVSHFAGTKVGQHGIEHFVFRPKCAQGACVTVLTRRNLAGLKSQQSLKPAGARYTSADSETAACTSGNGRLHARHGSMVKQTLTIVPTDVRNGVAGGFTGTGHVTATPTAEGRADHCGTASETYSIKSVS
jgi:hypothetical protein